MSRIKSRPLAFAEQVLGRTIEMPGGVSAWTVVKHYCGKALVPMIRGAVRAPFLRSSKFPIFMGPGVRIRFGSMLSVSQSVSLGSGVRIDALSTDGVHLGRRVTLRDGCIIQVSSHLDHLGHSVRIDDDVYIGPYAFIGAAGPVHIGQRTLIGPRLTIIAEGHQFDGTDSVYHQGVVREGVTIGEDCWIGANVTILDRVSIGRGSVIGAGSVVTRSLPEHSVAYGVPARLQRTRA